jgi:nicotinate phosphoribosyltransferase
MAHSLVQAHDDELTAFERFALGHPDNVVILIDTYDTEAGARKVVDVAGRLRAKGVSVRAVRIDSGDLGEHARRVRQILDQGGLSTVQILASSGLDESKIEALVAARAPIDGFAPGTALVTSSDAPNLDCAYKLVEYAGRPRFKRSEGKVLWPGVKQVHRTCDAGGFILRDRLTLAAEAASGEPLLAPVIRAGRRLHPSPAIEEVRAYAAAQQGTLPASLRGLAPAEPFPLEVSSQISAILDS